MKRMTLPIAALILALLPSLSFADGRFRGGFGRGFGGHSYGGYHGYGGFRHHSSFGLSLGFIFGGGPRYYDDYDYSYYRPVYRSYYPPPVYYDPAPVYYYDAPVVYRPVRHSYYDDCGPYYYRPSASISFSYSRYRYR